MFNPQDRYWIVADDTTKVYSSARNIYVDAATDADYLAFLDDGNGPSITDSEAGIWHLMQDLLPLFLWNGTTFSQPGPGLYTKDQLQNYNKQTRFTKVTGGTVAAGIPVTTDDRSRGLINSSRSAADADPNFTTKWYGSDGNFYDVDAAQMITLSTEVAVHTNNCYLVFEQVANKILLNQITALVDIDTAYGGL
jgi:hypothetical protein